MDLVLKLDGLMSTGTGTGDAQAIAQYLSTKPEFSSVDVNADNSVVAHFTDGTNLIVFSNQRSDGSVSAQASPSPMQRLTGERLADLLRTVQSYVRTFARRATDVVIPPAAAAAPASLVLPKGTTAITFSVNGYGGAASGLFVSGLNSAGYSATQLSGSVAEFRAINNVAVLHISSHGALVHTQEGTDEYSIGTGEAFPNACSDPSCDANTADRMAHLLDIGVYPGHDAPYYVMRAAFVTRYWHLAQNAVVFLDACSSMFQGPTEEAMRKAINVAGATSIVGWTSPVSVQGAQAVHQYLFDRLLGANAYQPESPPQRPFSLPEVMDYMTSTGRNRDTTPANPNLVAQLKLAQYGANASLLVPSIEYIEVQEDEKRLIVHGEFGVDPGTAKIDTLDRAPSPWTNDTMVIDLPVNGAGSYGSVVVYGPNGQFGNAVPLTEFLGTMKSTRVLTTTMGSSAFTDVADCTLMRFRADVHSHRSTPGSTPTDGASLIENAASNVKCTWTMTGSADIRVVGQSGTDTGDLPWADNSVNGPPPFISVTGDVIGGPTKSLVLNFNCSATAAVYVTDPLTHQVTKTDGPVLCMLGTETTGLLPLQSDFSLPAKTYAVAVTPPWQDTESIEMHFNTNSPPDDKTLE